MKILLTRAVDGQDYQLDCLLHGLRSVYGSSVVDSPKVWYMYKNAFTDGKYDKTQIYGRGFTIFGTLDDIEVDRENIEDKIRNQYYDFIIIWPFAMGSYIDLIKEFTPAEKLIYIDGHDYGGGHFIKGLAGYYFKREKSPDCGHLHNLSLAFPKEKILQYQLPKTQIIADLTPGDLSTYIYRKEDEYYNSYNKSLFSITHKKAGWDCMRHYEIIAARSLPWFKNIEHCPPTICTTLPKDLLIYTNKLIDRYGTDEFMSGELRQIYDHLNGLIFQHLLHNCTTEDLARYVIDTAVSKEPVTS